MEKLYLKPWKKHWKHAFLIQYFYKSILHHDFRKQMGYDLHLDVPKTFNEKIQWLKCYYRDPLMVTCADKVAVRKYVAEKLGGVEYLIPQYGIFNSADEIDYDALPDSFVLKPNHSSGRVIICSDKRQMDSDAIHKICDEWMHENYYYQNGEWQYKNIISKIICEKYIQTNTTDYKFFCFHGAPKLVNVIWNRRGSEYSDAFFDMECNKLPFRSKHESDKLIKMPINFSVMRRLACKLSEGFPFVRVDLYNVNGHIYFGELTFTPANGMDKFEPIEWDRKLGDMLDLNRCTAEYIRK